MPKKKKKKSKEATTQAEVVEDDTALDDKESLGTDAPDQEALLPTGRIVSEELARVHANIKAAQAKRNLAACQFFMFYENLLSKDAQYQWDKIVASQVDTAPWPTARVK